MRPDFSLLVLILPLTQACHPADLVIVPDDLRLPPGLHLFESCDEVLPYFQGSADYLFSVRTAAAVSLGKCPEMERCGIELGCDVFGMSPSARVPERDYSLPGVQEADIAKSYTLDDNTFALAAQGNAVYSAQVAPSVGQLTAVATFAGTVESIVVSDGRADIIWSDESIHISTLDFTSLLVQERAQVSGQYIRSQRVGAETYIYSMHFPRSVQELDYTTPEVCPAASHTDDAGYRASITDYVQRGRESIKATTLQNWIPSHLDCNDLLRPGAFGGLGVLTISALHADGSVTHSGIVGTTTAVFSGDDSILVATSPYYDYQWSEPVLPGYVQTGTNLTLASYLPTQTSEVHRFAMSSQLLYSASLEFHGQVALPMDERQGIARIFCQDAAGGTLFNIDTNMAIRGQVKAAAASIAGPYFSANQAIYNKTVFDTTDPSNPRSMGQVDDSSGSLRRINDQQAISIAASPFSMTLLDLSDPTHPISRGTLTEDSNFFTAAGEHPEIINIIDSHIAVPFFAGDSMSSGYYSDPRLRLYNITPAGITRVGDVTDGNSIFFRALPASDNIASFSTSACLIVDPDTATILSRLSF